MGERRYYRARKKGGITMFQITGDTLAGLIVGFALGAIAYRTYIKFLYEVVETDEKPEKEEQTTEPKSTPRTFGRSCQKFSSAMNIDSPDKCQYLNQASGHCALFNGHIFVLGGKYERCAECKDKYS